MAFGRLSDEGDDQPMADINMIPMIDVMLVLLIVFMITAPLLTDAVKLELPEASSQRNEPKPADISLSITFDGQVRRKGRSAMDTALEAMMAEAASKTQLPELQLKVDRQVDYGRVASVLALASQQGLHKLAFVSQPESAP